MPIVVRQFLRRGLQNADGIVLHRVEFGNHFVPCKHPALAAEVSTLSMAIEVLVDGVGSNLVPDVNYQSKYCR